MNRSTVLWLAYITTGDQTAFKHLFDEQTPVAIAVVRKCVGLSIERAQDAVQAAWLHMLTLPDKFDADISEFHHYFNGVAINKGRELRRTEGRGGSSSIFIELLKPLTQAAELDEAAEARFWDHALACWSRLSPVEQFLLVGTKQASFKIWFDVLRDALQVESVPLPSKEEFEENARLTRGRQKGWNPQTIDRTLDAMAKGTELPGAARGKLHRAWQNYKKCMMPFI